MEVLSKFKSSKGKKSTQAEQPPSKDEIISTLENYSADRSPANKENNNNSRPLSRGSSLDNKWDFLDCDPVSTPASLSHSYSLEWENLFNRPDVMRKLKEKALEGSLRSSRFRSVIWKLFLEVLPPQMADWINKTRKSRSKFEELKNRLIVNPRKAVDSVDITLNNPLSQDEESPWNKFFQDNELRLTIKQDVIRTYPKIEFFQSNQLRNLMVNILFIFAKEYPDLSYRQGMHELLAPLIFILHCDHQAFLHACEIETVLYCSEDARNVMKEVMDPAFLEHDAYAMFCQVMETVEPWYLSRDMFYCQSKSGSMRNLEMINATPFSRSQDLNPSSAIVTKLTRIQDYILKKFDPELHQHLERLEIVPQIYGIRWLRLLFGREFPMQDLLMLWDAIFGDGIGFDLVDYIFVAMLLYIRGVLLTNDYATCLTVLMKYPPVPDVHYFVVKALWLREPNTDEDNRVRLMNNTTLPHLNPNTVQATASVPDMCNSMGLSSSFTMDVYYTNALLPVSDLDNKTQESKMRCLKKTVNKARLDRQFPRPPNCIHQGSIKTSSSMDSSTDNISNIGAGGGSNRDIGKTHSRHQGQGQKRHNNMLGGFSSFSRKFSRPRTLAVPKSSSEPMNLQTDISPDHANNPIGSTVSLSQVEESMFRHNPSASSLARMESSNLRSAQSSPGIHHSTMFPLTPDDASITSSPTKYNTLPDRNKSKPKKLTKLEKEMQEKISHLQGELNDKKFMCRYCSSKLDVHIGRLQQELTRQSIEVDDDIMLSLAGLKLVRDILNGTLKFTQTIADDDDEIQINDDYYGNLDGGAESSTGVTSPDSDILLGAASCVDDETRPSKQQKHRLFYMSSEETNSPESIPPEPLASTRFKGSNIVELNDVYDASIVTTDNTMYVAGQRKLSAENAASDSTVDIAGGRKLSAENVGSADSVKGITSSDQFTSKIRRMFKGNLSHDQQLKQAQAQTFQSKSISVAGTGVSLAAYTLSDDERSNVSKPSHIIHPDETKTLGARRNSKEGQTDRELASMDTRWRTKSNVESSFHWPVFSPSPPERRSSRGSQSGYSDEEGRGERSIGRQEDEQKVRGRSKSQPSAFSGSTFHPLYRASEDEEYKLNPLYKLRYQEDMEH